MPWDVREADGKYCVYKIGSDTPVAGGCHDRRADAVKHQRALYANEPKMKHSVQAFADVTFEDAGEDAVWLKAWRYSTWDHPIYGQVEVTPEMGQQFKSYLDSGALGRDHLVNYDHGVDPAKGGKAAGQILDVEPRDDGIYYKVMFTDVAKQEIKNKEWRYLSPEYDDWVNPESGDVLENMMFDLALTNTPFFKGMPPLNFSEVYTETPISVKTEETPKGGKTMDELLRQFAERLGVDLAEDASDEDILAKADELNSAIEPLRKARDEGAKMRTFREAFPEEFKEMEKLRMGRVESEARTFAEDYRRFTIRGTDGDSQFKSSFGFSELVIDEITDTYKKFSTKSATPTDLKKLLDLIGDRGIVDYSESGSSRGVDGKQRSEDPKLAFSEAVMEVMTQDNLDYEQAIAVAQMKFPDLYEEYQRAIPRI